jgi:hypothetical protein
LEDFSGVLPDTAACGARYHGVLLLHCAAGGTDTAWS